jgi:hypothetical protein
MGRPVLLLLLVLSSLLLAGCDMLGIESATAIAARREAEGKAIGGACRNAGRAIEDCYALNRKADKAAMYAGWREMNDYMRDNKMDPVPPQIGPPVEVAKSGAAEGGDAAAAEGGDKPAAGDKAAGKPADDKPAANAKSGRS